MNMMFLIRVRRLDKGILIVDPNVRPCFKEDIRRKEEALSKQLH